jgi:hypothetical protein
MSVMSPDSLKKSLPAKTTMLGWALFVAGVVLTAVAYLIEPRHAAYNNVIGLLLLISVSVGAVFLIALEYLTGAVWSVPMRRIVEFISGLVVVVPLLAIPLFFSLHEVFEWTHINIVTQDKLLTAKAPYLNEYFFSARFVVFATLWIVFYWLFTHNSLRQDTVQEAKFTRRNVRLGALFMPIFAITITFTAVDWIMSIEPHWFSTILGVYYFSGTVLAALGVATYFVITLHETGALPNLRRDHFYSLGALMFVFTNFWAYIAFSQFMLTWYANLPEETFWFIKRWQNGWEYVSILLIIVRFAVPYAVLLSQEAKMDPRRLKIMALWMLGAHMLDLYWLTMPTFSSNVTLSWIELSTPVLVTGTIILMVSYKMKRHNLVPVGDPKLKRGWDFHL